LASLGRWFFVSVCGPYVTFGSKKLYITNDRRIQNSYN
jgi:hypothetical protein